MLEASPQDACQQETGLSSKKGLGREKRKRVLQTVDPKNCCCQVSTLGNECLIDGWLLGWCWECLEFSMWEVHGPHSSFVCVFSSFPALDARQRVQSGGLSCTRQYSAICKAVTSGE